MHPADKIHVSFKLLIILFQKQRKLVELIYRADVGVMLAGETTDIDWAITTLSHAFNRTRTRTAEVTLKRVRYPLYTQITQVYRKYICTVYMEVTCTCVQHVQAMSKGLKGKARIPTDDLIPKNRRRNQHSLAFQIPSASKEAYKSSFFPQTIRDWNDLPDSLISSAEMSDDCVSKFASLVRSRD